MIMAVEDVQKGPAILIGGVARIGKTRLAKELSRHTGFNMIHCDQFREAFWSIRDEQKRAAERVRCYEKAIAAHPAGLIMEGDDLIYRNRGDTSLAKLGLLRNDLTLCLALLVHLKSRLGAQPFVVGCAERDSVAVAAEIRRRETDSCFTRVLSDHGLQGFLRTAERRSKELRTMVAGTDIPYIELGGEDLECAVEAAAARILRAL